jgi:diaminopimelate decarboxylase/aspartate kinase
MSMLVHRALGVTQSVETPYPDSRWVAMKFGGKSVSTVDNWKNIVGLLRDRVAERVTPMVCHSALVGVSNALIALLDLAVADGATDPALAEIVDQHRALAAELGVDADPAVEIFTGVRQLVEGAKLLGEVSPRVHARVLASGELAATKLGAAYLQAQGLKARWLDARELLLATTNPDHTERARFLSARCSFDYDAELEARLGALDGFALTQGFIARNESGETVLLGRGGSDTSGAYFAGKLRARRLEIWTDVPGFYSADPRAVPSARLIRSLHYQEAQEIASAGGGILHPRSISPVRTSGIPLFLKCTAHPEWEGSVISNAVEDDVPQLKAISHRGGITLVSMESLEMWHQVGFLAGAFDVFRKHGLSVDLISTSESSVTVSIDVGANVTDDTAIEALAEDLRALCRVRVIRDCAAVTLVGRRIRTILHELGPVLEVFQEQPVHLVTQAANDLNLTFVVSSEHAYRLVQHLHGLLVDKFEGGAFGKTWEQLINPDAEGSRVARAPQWWTKRRKELIEIANARGAAYVYDRASIEQAVKSLLSLESVDKVFYSMKANANREILKIVYDLGVNFECVSPGEIGRVLEVVPKIDRRRILFTPNFAPRSEYEWRWGRAFGSRSTTFSYCANGAGCSKARKSFCGSTRAVAGAITSTCARRARTRSSACRCSRWMSSRRSSTRAARESSACMRTRAAACFRRPRGKTRASGSSSSRNVSPTCDTSTWAGAWASPRSQAKRRSISAASMSSLRASRRAAAAASSGSSPDVTSSPKPASCSRASHKRRARAPCNTSESLPA